MKVSEPMTEEAFQVWLLDTVARYPEIDSIHLTGSRSEGSHKPDSDYDLVVCLSEALYDTETIVSQSGYRHKIARRKDDTELRIALSTRRPAIEIFFLRPDGLLARYMEPEEYYKGQIPGDQMEGLLEICGTEEKVMEALMDGHLLGDYDRLYRSLKKAQPVYIKLLKAIKKQFKAVKSSKKEDVYD